MIGTVLIFSKIVLAVELRAVAIVAVVVAVVVIVVVVVVPAVGFCKGDAGGRGDTDDKGIYETR